MAADVQGAEGQACTIYLPTIAYERVWEVVNKSGFPSSLEGAVSEWSRLTVMDDEATLTLTPTRRIVPGDKFSKLVLGTLNFFERIPSAPADRQRLIADFVANCQLMIGVRGRPAFTDAHMDVIFEIAQACNGMIFNGSGMIDGDGRMILNSDGTFDP